jgi:NTE family protein
VADRKSARAEPEAPHATATPFESIALLLQGGGALGAYQGGVYQALAMTCSGPIVSVALSK